MTLTIPKRSHRRQAAKKVEADPPEPSLSPVSDPLGEDDTPLAIPIELLSVKQAAAYLGVAEITVRRWINEGVISCLRAGRQIRIDRAALIKLLNKNSSKRGC